MDLGNGIVTPGGKSLEVMKQETDKFFSKVDLNGKSLLDIGAWNGGFSLEAKRRGAKRVAALDYHTWNAPLPCKGDETFQLMAEVTNTQYEMYTIDLDTPAVSLKHLGSYDVVLFAGVFYHLVDPIAALREVSALVREVLIFETHIETTQDTRPWMVFYPGSELANDPTNWWGPNTACIVALLKHFGFSRVEASEVSPASRCTFHAYRNK